MYNFEFKHHQIFLAKTIVRQSSEIAHYEQVTHWCNALTLVP